MLSCWEGLEELEGLEGLEEFCCLDTETDTETHGISAIIGSHLTGSHAMVRSSCVAHSWISTALRVRPVGVYECMNV